MTKSKALICSIIGPSGKSGDILAEAVDRVSGVLSPEGDLPFDFQWERDIFYEMGKKYGEQPGSAQKAATRTAHEVFDALQKDGEKMAEVIGITMKETPSPPGSGWRGLFILGGFSRQPPVLPAAALLTSEPEYVSRNHFQNCILNARQAGFPACCFLYGFSPCCALPDVPQSFGTRSSFRLFTSFFRS